jgi:iron(III) transport system ATP-binding protein
MPDTQRAPRLVVDGLVVAYDGKVEVNGVCLIVLDGTITALVGPSGCGKTSLLRSIAGFELPAAGRIEIGGREVVGPSTWVAPEKREVGMVFQQGALFPHLRVRENVGFGVKGCADARERTEAVLDLVGLDGLRDRYPDQLSGGQQQLVSLARALAPSPKLVLLDEPFANLDAALRTRMREEVCEILRAARITALLVSHDQEEALSVADRLAVMSGGRLLQEGPPEEIYHRPTAVEVAEFIGGGQLVDCRIDDGTARSVLGAFPTGAPTGPARLLVRPEDLTLTPATGGEEIVGEVVGRSFYGHDLINEVRLQTGEILRVRVLSHADFGVGSQVRIRPRDKLFQAFPEPVHGRRRESRGNARTRDL